MSAKQKETAVGSLTRIFAPDQVVTHSLALLTYETDAGLDRGRPDAILFPTTSDDVVRIVEWAKLHGVPLIARGAGTGLSGGAVAENGGVIVEFSRMSRIVEIDEIGGRAIVEPGVVNAVLDDQLRPKGLYFPPDPASGRVSTIGGNIAENAGGPHCFKYGVTTNYVTGLDVLRADGRRVKMGGPALDYPEYDFVGILTGSEGTLGILTQASVRLIRRAPAIKTLMAAFDSVKAAGMAVSAIIARGLVPATLEMMDHRIIRILEDYTRAGLPVEAEAALIVEVDGYPESLSPQMDDIVAILQKHRAYSLRLAQTAEERDQIWYARKSVGGALSRIAPSYYPVDGTVPRSKIAETLTAINQICANLDLSVAYVLHAGDGNLHPHIFIDDPNDRALVARVLQAGEQVMEWCVRQGGSITGEHGVGTEKRHGMLLMYSGDELAAMRDVKEVFDPKGLLNPGKIFPADVPSTSTLQIPATVVHAPVPSASPASAPEAAALLRAWFADGSRKTVRIRGGGTKSGLLPPTDRTLCTESLVDVLAFKPEDLYVTVGAGARLADLQRQLVGEGMWLPLVSPWPAATIGGMVATNSNAPLRMRVGYGGVRDLVLAATVVLPDARVIRVGRPVVKNVAGYDMVKLFVGSQGTLGLISDVTLRITPLPRARASLLVPYEELEPGMHCAIELLRNCLVASAVLLCRGCNVPGVSAPYALVYTAEGQKEDVATELAEVRETLQAKGITRITQSELAGSEIWATWLGTPRTDIVLRAGLAPRALAQVLLDLSALGDSPFIADIANGQLYLCATQAVQAIQQAVRGVGGYTVVLSAPVHRRGEIDIWGHAPQTIDLMRKLKARWDPHGLLNPGAFLV